MDYPERGVAGGTSEFESFVAERQAGDPAGFRGLRVWQVAFELAADCHRFTRTLPQEERYELGSQIRRAAASISANLAEGWGRDSDGDFERSVQMALGSLRELETHLLLCKCLELADAGAIDDLAGRCDPLGGMLFRLRKTIRARRVASRSLRRSQRKQEEN